MQLFHDSRNPFYRSPSGAQPCGTQVTLRLKVESQREPEKVCLRVWDGEERKLFLTKAEQGLYEVTFYLPRRPCLLWYDFQVWEGKQFSWYGNAQDGLGGEGDMIWGSPRSFQITVYDPDFQAPEWTKGAVFYQIFPDRFARSGPLDESLLPQKGIPQPDWDGPIKLSLNSKDGNNQALDFYGGNLKGIMEKLPYLASLGVTVLYFNPIFEGRTNHRYDTVNYRKVAPLLGTNEDFEQLCREAGRLGIRVILDGVFNHTGSEHPYFLHAQQHPDSPYIHWYRFKKWPDEYQCWWGFVKHPDMNKQSPEVQKEFVDSPDCVMRHWIRRGAGGWRLDVADELPMAYLKKARKAVKTENPQALLLGEVWEDASHKVAYDEMRCYCLGDTLDGVMNYPLRNAALDFLTGKADAHQFARQMSSLYENYPAPFSACLMNLLGSHDRARVINTLCGREGLEKPRMERQNVPIEPDALEKGQKLLQVMLSLIVSMPGIPCVYYGDEAGMQGADDPFNRKPFPWGHEDEKLTEMFRRILSKRRQEMILSLGGVKIQALSADVLRIERSREGKTLSLILNRTEKTQTCRLGAEEITLEPFETRWM